MVALTALILVNYSERSIEKVYLFEKSEDAHDYRMHMMRADVENYDEDEEVVLWSDDEVMERFDELVQEEEFNVDYVIRENLVPFPERGRLQEFRFKFTTGGGTFQEGKDLQDALDRIEPLEVKEWTKVRNLT